MYSERLYSLAFAVRKTKLWKTLYDNELFAVSMSNGEIGYCSVMGALGEHLALALYIGSEGLDSYRLFQEANHMEMNVLKTQEFMLSQVCLQCSFESKEELSSKELYTHSNCSKFVFTTYASKLQCGIFICSSC